MHSDFPVGNLHLPPQHISSGILGCGLLNSTLASQGGASESRLDTQNIRNVLSTQIGQRETLNASRENEISGETLGFHWDWSLQGPLAILLRWREEGGGFQDEANPDIKKADLCNGESNCSFWSIEPLSSYP